MELNQEGVEQLLRASNEEREQAAAVGRIHLWDKAMRRAFKGIFTRKQSHAALQRSVKKHNLLDEE